MDAKSASPLLFIILSMFALLPAAAHAQGAVEIWVQRYNGSGNGDDYPEAIAVDSDGNVIVSGYSRASVGGYDYTTIKYSGAGLPVWTNHYNGPGNSSDVAHAVAVDGRGNVFVTGYSTVTGLNKDYATLAYSSAGVPLWTNRYNGPGNSADEANAVVVGAGGNVYVTGVSSGSGSGSDYATIAYAGTGEPLWTNRYNGPGNGADNAVALAVDANSNLVVTGVSYGSSYYNEYATIKYSSAGLPLWTNRYGPGYGPGYATAVAVDAGGDVYVAGSSSGGNSGSDYATIKYSSAGVPLWTNLYNGPGNTNDHARALAVDRSNNVYVTGDSAPWGYNPTRYDYATIAYSSAGVGLWTNWYTGWVHDDEAFAIAVDLRGNVSVTGQSWGSGVAMDFGTIKYSKAGIPLWTNRYNGPANGWDVAQAVAVDVNGNVFVTGQSWNGVNYDYVTIKYSLQPIPLDSQQVANQLVLSWTNPAFHLQCAPTVTAVFTNLLKATSPWTNPITGDSQYFRLISE